jgi:arsenate reductase (thioredoxin)
MAKVYNVLFLCNSNSGRSIMAEALLNHGGGGRFRAFSGGSQPAGEVHPYTLEMLRQLGLPVEGLRSKSWDEFAAPGAPEMDFIFTVCDEAEGEVCPVWPGQPVTGHWSFPDPLAFQGSEEQKRAHFRHVLLEIESRIQLFLQLPIEKLDRVALHHEVRQIGAAQAAPSGS